MASTALALVPKRMSLWEHVADVENIADLVDALDRAGELTPELTEELQKALILAVAGTKAKIDRCAGVLEQFETAEGSAKREIERLEKRAARFKRQREYLELVCLAVLDRSRLDAMDGNTATIARHKLPLKLGPIADPSEIPTEYLRWPEEPPPPPPEPDKKLILAALKRDPKSVPGCSIATRAYKLVRS